MPLRGAHSPPVELTAANGLTPDGALRSGARRVKPARLGHCRPHSLTVELASSKKGDHSLGGGVLGKSGEETPGSRREDWPSPSLGRSPVPCLPPFSTPIPILDFAVVTSVTDLRSTPVLSPNPNLPPSSAACWAVSARGAHGGKKVVVRAGKRCKGPLSPRRVPVGRRRVIRGGEGGESKDLVAQEDCGAENQDPLGGGGAWRRRRGVGSIRERRSLSYHPGLTRTLR